MKTAAILCIFPALLSCGGRETPAPSENPRRVDLAAAERRELPDEVRGFGTLSFRKKVDIAAPQDAVLERLYFREGEAVREGDEVALLENPQITLAVERAENTHAQAAAALELALSRLREGEFQAEARLLENEKAEAELAGYWREYAEMERKQRDQETLFAAGGISEETVRSGRFALESEAERIRLMEKELEIRRIGFRDEDLLNAGFVLQADAEERRRALVRLATATLKAECAAAEAQKDAALKELESARLAWTELRVKSPAAGIVGVRYAEAGERLKREDTIMTLMDTRSLYAVFSVPERDALRLRPGMTARVDSDAGGSYEGTVDLVAPAADSQSFTFSVRVLLSPEALARGTLPAGEGKLKPGMFVRVFVTLGPPRELITVPEDALVNKKDGQGTVFVVSGRTASERKVVFGASLGADREIQSGLTPGEAVVLRPDRTLRDGEYVSAN
jgi:RND family efflux transporter MFP subunit